jgi:hypothetical protein
MSAAARAVSESSRLRCFVYRNYVVARGIELSFCIVVMLLRCRHTVAHASLVCTSAKDLIENVCRTWASCKRHLESQVPNVHDFPDVAGLRFSMLPM